MIGPQTWYQVKTVMKKAGEKSSNTSDIRARLLSMILGSELKSGQRIVEDDLCERLEVGRTPLRETLLVLQGEGYLERNRGWVVSQVDSSQISAIFESRAAIEGATARLAARHADESVHDALDKLILQMDEVGGLQRHELNALNNAFHQLIVDASENPFLVDFHKRTKFQYWLLRVPVLFSENETSLTNQQHRDILAALRDRDEDKAERLAREHVETTRNIVEPALRM